MSTRRDGVALVTGANKGIGFEVARQLARAGMQVVIGSRDPERGQAAAAQLQQDELNVRAEVLDVADHGSITQAASSIAEHEGRLDVLLNNAGIADPGDGSPATADPGAVRRLLETNFIGALGVTQAMLPLLQKAPSACIINHSSGLGSLTLHGDPEWVHAPFKLIGYSASKAALNMLTVQLAAVLKTDGIAVVSVDPGFTATDLNGHRGVQHPEDAAATAVQLALSTGMGETGKFFSSAGEEPW